MKYFTTIFAWSLFMLGGQLVAQTSQTAAAGNGTATTQDVPPPTAFHVVKSGADNRVWQREVYEKMPDGHVVTHTHSFTELASGMNFINSKGEWAESKELIEPYANGAVAAQGAYQVIFANNLNSAGSIDLQTPDGKRLRSSILGLAYYDSSTGQSVMIAQIQDSLGELISSNQVLYTNAFSGVSADVRYTYKKGSFEQDVILREQPPAPESFGLKSETTAIEVLTEFVDPPQEATIEHRDPQSGQVDEDISWGQMRIGHGKAFDLGGENKPHDRVSVKRRYATLDGRKFLMEIVPFNRIKAKIQDLPLQSSTGQMPKCIPAIGLLPPKLPVGRIQPQPMKFASVSAPGKGYVLDYIELSTSSDFTFRGDTTYLADGEFNLTGTTTIEGGAVIKADQNGLINIDASGSIVCKTAPYHPAIFTSLNDDATGEGAFVGDPYYNGTIDGGGSPAYTDVTYFFNLDCSNAVLSNLRFAYTYCAINTDGGWSGSYSTTQSLDIWDCQFVNMDVVVYAMGVLNLGLHNVLMGNVNIPGDGAIQFNDAGNCVAEQCTFDSTWAGGGVDLW